MPLSLPCWSSLVCIYKAGRVLVSFLPLRMLLKECCETVDTNANLCVVVLLWCFGVVVLWFDVAMC